MRPAGAAALALLVGMVAPLAVGSFSWEQRAAFGLLVFVGAAAAGPLWLGRRRAVLALLGLSVAGLVATMPAAAQAEVTARADRESRTGQRLLRLSDPERALPHLEAALLARPAERAALAAAALAHYRLAEREVAHGVDAAAYARAAEQLDRALALAPDDERLRSLSEAVKAVRIADTIWNAYDWPRTIGELRKAEALRPDLPGLKEKLAAAEASYAAVGGRPSPGSSPGR